MVVPTSSSVASHPISASRCRVIRGLAEMGESEIDKGEEIIVVRP
jgi:hypothetical protein